MRRQDGAPIAARARTHARAARAEAVPYLAYGSNLHPLRLGARIPAARLLGTVAVSGWRIAYDKRGTDGSAKCTLIAAGADDVVHAALYRLTPADRRRLDTIEGPGYTTVQIPVTLAGRRYEAFTYVARPEHRAADLSPFDWYRRLVLAGAHHLGFPPEYCARLAGVSAVADPDPLRRARHERLLARIEPRRITRARSPATTAPGA